MADVKLTTPTALQEDRKPALSAALPSSEQRSGLTGGPDQHLASASRSGDPTGMTGKDSMGQPTNKPRP